MSAVYFCLSGEFQDAEQSSSHNVGSSFTGNFDTQYSSKTVTSFDPPMMGQSGSTSNAKANRLGDCPAGMKPGDVEMANGKTFNGFHRDEPPGILKD